MAIDLNHRFIYIHIPRTGGTSISRALEDLPWRDLSGGDFLRYRADSWELKLRCRLHRIQRFHKHETAENIRSVIGERVWSRNYTFAIVRNPWDLAVSCYHWWRQLSDRFARFQETSRMIKEMSFPEYMESPYGRMINQYESTMLDWISDRRGKVLVDFIGRFESLDESWQKICEGIGVRYQTLPDATARERNRAQTLQFLLQ